MSWINTPKKGKKKMINSFLKSRVDDCKKLVTSLNKHYDYVSILGSFVKQKRVLVSTYATSIDDIDSECGFVIKVYKDGHYGEYSCNDVHGLKANEVITSLILDKPFSKNFKVPMLNETEHVESFSREDKNPLSDDEILSKLKTVKKKCEKFDKRIVTVNTVYMKREVSKIFVSNKKVLDQKYDWINAILMTVVRDGDNIKNNYHAEGECDSKKALSLLNKNTNDVCDITVRLLDATPIKPGTYDIITNPSISGLIAHEAFGHGVEMDMFVKNRAKAKDFIGKYVASPIVNMFDGAAATLSAASYFFDDDGVEASSTQIIKDGILQTGISDSLSALELGTKPTGNGRRESFSHKVYTRMTNTFFGPGNDTFEDMIKTIKHGYYLCDTNNGMEDPKNWQIQCMYLMTVR